MIQDPHRCLLEALVMVLCTVERMVWAAPFGTASFCFVCDAVADDGDDGVGVDADDGWLDCYAIDSFHCPLNLARFALEYSDSHTVVVHISAFASIHALSVHHAKVVPSL